MKRNQPPREKKLIAEIKNLRQRLEESEQTVEAIHRGEVDALVISGPQGDQIYTLTGAEHTYRVLLEGINEGAVTMTCDGSITYCNNRFTDITKAPPTQVINSSIYEFFSLTDRTVLKEILQKGGGGSEFYVQAKDGMVVPVYLSCTSVEMNGTPSRCLVITDLTVQRKNEERKLVEPFYRRIFDHIHEGALIFGFTERTSLKNGTIFYANYSFARLVKRPLPSVIGSSIFKIIRKEDIEDVTAMLRDTRLHGGQGREIQLTTGDGGLVSVLFSASQTLSKAVAYAIVTDLTEIKRREQESKRLANELLRAQEKERKRIANELHDGLAANLSAVKMALENKLGAMVANRPSEVRIEDLTALLQRNIEEVRRIMANLHPSMLDDLGIVATLQWFCREYQKMYPHINVELQLSASEEEISAPLKTTIYRISQESLNNIAKHSHANSVTLSLKNGGKSIELEIKDNGQGFDLSAISKRKDHTTGFGLGSMRERAEILGGSFSIESSVGAGTSIRASWPITSE